MYRARGHWTQGAAGALVDMSTARREAVRAVLYPEGQRGGPEQARRQFDAAVKKIAPYFKDVDLPDEVTAERITTIDLSRRPGLLLQLKAQEFIAAVYELASVDEINRAIAVAWLGRQGLEHAGGKAEAEAFGVEGVEVMEVVEHLALAALHLPSKFFSRQPALAFRIDDECSVLDECIQAFGPAGGLVGILTHAATARPTPARMACSIPSSRLTLKRKASRFINSEVWDALIDGSKQRIILGVSRFAWIYAEIRDMTMLLRALLSRLLFQVVVEVLRCTRVAARID